MTQIPNAAHIVALAFTLVAALVDARRGLIPNRLTLPLLVAAPLAHALLSGPGALRAALVGALLCSAVPVLLFTRRAMGGGDVKLLTALGAILGPGLGMRVQVAGFAAAGVVALALLFRTRLLASSPEHGSEASGGGRYGTGLELRFGPPLFVATALVMTLEHWT